MTHYQRLLNRVRNTCYSNESQLSVVIGIRNYMNENFDSDLNLDMLARVQHISKFHLIRLFKKYYGQTPKQYLTDKRIERSKEYLKEGRSVSESCYLVGFESPSSFATLFKRKNGRTPTDFQKEQFSQSCFNHKWGTLQHLPNKLHK